MSTEQVAIVEHAVRTVTRPGLEPERVVDVEQTLTGHASVFGPKDLRLLARHLVEACDPDGTEPDDALAQERRH